MDPFTINPFTSSSQNSSDPFSSNPFQAKDISSAKKQEGSNAYNNLCEKFVEENVYGKSNIYPSAADAWNDYVSKGKAYQGTEGMQPGNMIYFAPDKGNMEFGHTGIVEPGNSFISATYGGVKSYDINDWQNRTGQQILGYVRP